MDTSRDRAANPEGGTSIRLRYTRQFQSGSHAHSIDAEATLPPGVSQERREQIIREMEAGVEQLARQITQSASRSADETHAQNAGRPGVPSATVPMATNRTAEMSSAAPQRSASATAPVTRAPVSESMPAAPSPSGERTIRLADFINAIKKYWDMSPQEAMQRLNVKSLNGLNYRDAFNSLKAIMEAEGKGLPARNPQTQPGASRPVVEAPRQPNRNPSQQTNSRPPTNQATQSAQTPATRPQGPTALKEVARPAPPTQPVPVPAPEVDGARHESRAGVDFAGSPRAPIPIQLGVVRDTSQRAPYFDEEDELNLSEDEEFELPGEESEARRKARRKLEELKGTRGNSAASAGRLNVLNNVIDSLISEEQLQQLIQGVWNIAGKKKLKNEQVEALISWAKEDYFADEAVELLDLLAEKEE